MPGQRTIPNFFSVITSVNAAANSGNGSQSNSIRNGRRALETSSWIINEIQQAQSQIQQALQGNLAEFIPNNANTANGSAVSPTLMSQGNPFLHPRQSAQAEMMPLHSEINNDSSSIRHNPGVNAALTRSPSINIVNDEFDDAYGSHGINSPTIDPSRVLRFEVGDLNTFSLRNGATIQRIAEGNVNMQVSGSRSVSSSTRSGNSNQATLQPPHSQQQHQIQTTLHSAPPSALRNKIVYRLNCAYCKINVCERAMRAILLADTKIELYSTDIPPRALRTLDEDRLTQGCNCRIRDTLCSECGNVLGYHVSQPCDRCLDARNNGHFWMFYSEGVCATERKDADGCSPLFWAALTPMCEFVPASATIRPGLAANYNVFENTFSR